LDKYIPVDVWVSGCPPRPQLIIAGVAQAAQLLADGATADQKRTLKSC
jgi:Ni,Fe-hydrogenase III small subunit